MDDAHESLKHSPILPAVWEPNWDTSVYKRKKNCKKRRDPMEPQKPVSAYALFFRDTQAAIKSRNPKASFGDISKTVASMWDTLDGETKNQYKKRTDMAKKEYLKRLAAYRARLISTVGLHHSWQTVGFCNQSPPPAPAPAPATHSVVQSESTPTVCSPTLGSTATDYRPATFARNAYPQQFDCYSQRSDVYYASVQKREEANEMSHYQRAPQAVCQPFDTGAQAIAQSTQASLYGAYPKTNASLDTYNQSYDYAAQRGGRYVAQMMMTPMAEVRTLGQGYNVQGQCGGSERSYINGGRVHATSGYDAGAQQAAAVGSMQMGNAYYSAAYGRPGVGVSRPYNGYEARPAQAAPYGTYWTTANACGMAQVGQAMGTDVRHASLANVHCSPSSSSCSSSTSTSVEDSATQRTEMTAPAESTILQSVANCGERSGTFDYWTNAIGYY